jgi:hypothetical protein
VAGVARASKLCELPLQEVKLLVETAVKLCLSLERGTAATVYTQRVADALVRLLNLGEATGPERSLVVDVVLKDLREVVDLKGRRWRLDGYRSTYRKGGAQARYAVYYARADLYSSELARKMPVECPLHPSKICLLRGLSDGATRSPFADGASHHEGG